LAQDNTVINPGLEIPARDTCATCSSCVVLLVGGPTIKVSRQDEQARHSHLEDPDIRINRCNCTGHKHCTSRSAGIADDDDYI